MRRRRPARWTVRDSRLRRIVVDIGAVSARRHVMPAWFEVDITEARHRLQQSERVSLTVS